MVVRIAGAGLTGLFAAIVAARLGETVEVFEVKKRLLPSSGPHSEGLRNYLARDALEELRSFGFDFRPFGTVAKTIRRSRNHENVLHGPAYYLFLRGRETSTLDQQLYNKALDLGVLFHFGTAAPENAEIVATGPPKGQSNVIGAGFTFSSRGANLEQDTVWALLDNDAAPGGYLVISPGREFHSIYSVSWTDLDYQGLLAMFEKAIRAPWIRQILGTSRRMDKIHGRAYFAENPIDNAKEGGRLRAGEAGGFQDAIAGFGFRYSVITGSLAARALVEGLDYAALLRETFGPEFREAFRYRQKLSRATNDDFDKLVAILGPSSTIEEHRRLREAVRII